MQYARESTLHVEVSDPVWAEAAKYLSESELISMVLAVAWYNSGVRIMAGLRIELEAGYE